VTAAQLAHLARVMRATRTAAAGVPTRRHLQLGPFDLYLETERPLRWFTFAIPQDGARPTAADVARLTDTCRDHDREPRVECLPALAPDAVAALHDAGWVDDLTGPLMICTDPQAAPEVPGLSIEELGPDAPEASIRDYDRVQRAAFGDPPGDTDVEAFRRRSGTGVTLLARVDGRAAATGVVLTPDAGCAEVAGIGTLPGLRGRGVAGALTAELTARAFALGAELAFLTPGGAESQRVYERAGFRGTGTFLHLSSRA
jgi:GNAT superfamily N-acetyltransferase